MNSKLPSSISQSVSDASIEQAVQALRQGHLIGLPTETVYGLAAPVDQPQSIRKIFQTKERPFFDPLIVHVESITQAKKYVQEWPAVAQVLAENFWPGPLTLVLTKNHLIDDLITSGLPSVGLRCPNHPMALKLIHQYGAPLAAPSANKFGKTSPTSAAHVESEFPNENLVIIDGGPCEVGIESTVLALKKNSSNQSWEYSILRPGFVSLEQIQIVLQKNNLALNYLPALSKAESPGHMKHHYMPAKPLILIKDKKISESEIRDYFNQHLDQLPSEVEGVKIIKPQKKEFKLIEMKLPTEASLAARSLYAQLRETAELDGDIIYFYLDSNLEQHDLWSSILERLTKAATLVM